MTESIIIELIAKKLNCKNKVYGLGNFGDDAYTVPGCNNSEVLVQSTDSFVEETHFTKDMGYFSIGWKSLVTALSDVYAMGAYPSFYSLNLILPKDIGKNDLDEFLEGLKQASDDHDVKLLGGDISRGKSLCIVVQASGYQRKEHIKSNKGAAKGDVLITNGNLGHALLGLHEFQKGFSDTEFIEAFLFPKLNKELGPWLSQFSNVTSLTDISDGLYRELENLCALNDLSVMVEDLPMPQAFRKACESLSLSPGVTALQGGEDYSLLWTVKPDFLTDFLQKYQIKFKTKPFVLGRVEAFSSSKSSKRRISYENQDLIESIRPFEHFTS